MHAETTYANLNETIASLTKYQKDSWFKGPKYKFKYSSMAEYLRYVQREAKENKIEWSRKTGDFWEYNYESVKYAYWTGFFTTHPDFKRTAAIFGDFTQSSQLINSLSAANLASGSEAKLEVQQNKLLETLSVMQHHDALTGTHPKATGDDYLRMMKAQEIVEL